MPPRFPNARARLAHALDAAVEHFVIWLQERGYAEATVEEKARFVRRLARWEGARRISLAGYAEESIASSLRKHRRAVCPNYRRALFHFLEFLRERGVVAPPRNSARSTPVERLEARYVRYLENERGLARVTIINYGGLVHRFLEKRFGDGPTSLRELTARDVVDFLVRYLPTTSPKRGQLMGSAMRSFLRFAFLESETDVDLSFALPEVRHARKAAIPRYVSARDVERILATCNLTTPVGRRDHAVLLLLARLGLRASEVVKMELGDLHWRASEVLVRGKGAARDHLPIPADVGEALSRYLARDRAPCASRRVFVRLRAPLRGFATATAVSTIAKRAIDRAGVRAPSRGAHLLRHSLAAGMVQRGATMVEIGQILRHRSPNSTELYARVDFDGLRELALPWLGKGGAR